MSLPSPAAIAQARTLACELSALVKGLDPGALLPADAVAAVETFSAIKDLAAHAELLAAGAVAAGGGWVGTGEPSAAHWLARTSGVGLGEARDVLATARRLASLPAVD
jgi:hypothetical protein